MRPVPPLAAVLALLLAAAGVLGVPGVGAAAAPAASQSLPVSGNVTGPSVVPIYDNVTYYLNATGGPAVVNGTLVGNLTYTVNLSGANTTGSSVTPTNGSITNLTGPVDLNVTIGGIPQRLTLSVDVTSTLLTNSTSRTFTVAITVVMPYTVRAVLVTGPYAGVLAFSVNVYLDGAEIGNVTVPALSANSTYNLTYRYATTGLSAGYHTFTLSLLNEHGLVTFGRGLTVLSVTFYVPAGPPNNTIWVVAGIVAFFGALFIFATRVAARRQGAARR